MHRHKFRKSYWASEMCCVNSTFTPKLTLTLSYAKQITGYCDVRSCEAFQIDFTAYSRESKVGGQNTNFTVLPTTSWLPDAVFCKIPIILLCFHGNLIFSFKFILNQKLRRIIFSRPGRSQGLLYKHLRHSFSHSVMICENIFTALPRFNGCIWWF